MDVWERVLGFADAQAVLTAHDRGVFDALGDGPATGAAVAACVSAACVLVRTFAASPCGGSDRTLFAVRQDLNMLVSARGRERSESEYRDWIRRHGFALKRTYPATFGKHYMVAERL